MIIPKWIPGNRAVNDGVLYGLSGVTLCKVHLKATYDQSNLLTVCGA